MAELVSELQNKFMPLHVFKPHVEHLLSTVRIYGQKSLSGLIAMYIYPLYKTRWHKKHCTMRYHIMFIFSSVN